ncbi:protein NLRC5-like [Sardina pilchardus]|uniref:protein NLRC5-like n=1 Tax=Sardina pilchardus TaxID=27697 RepID=UPI002E11D69B
MDLPQEGEDAVGGNQTGRAACVVSSHESLKDEESVTDGHQGVSKGQGLCSVRPQTHRPVSPVPSCVSLKSDWSMGEPLQFRSDPPQSDSKPQTHRPVSPVPSCVSLKSDWSMGEPLQFRSDPPQSDSKPQTHRPVSPVPSCVSLKSDWSMGEPLQFRSDPPQLDSKPQTHRPVSPVPSCVSLKSDWSMVEPLQFRSDPPQLDSKPQTYRPVSPVPSCVSLKSDWSMGEPLQFRSDPPQSDSKPQTHRPVSPAPSCVSMKSDWSMGEPLQFRSDPPQSDSNGFRNSLTQDQSRCGVCEQLLRDPVITSCGHRFCRQCISSYWSKSGPSGDYSCPQCRKRPRTHPLLNPPIKRAKITDNHVLNEILMTHKASMKRRFESICEGIIRSGTQTLLNKIYTELYITEGESEGVNSEHEVWQVESASRPQTTDDTAINCNDIFKPLPGEERHIRTVMTKGIAGIGKTVSVQKFILDWAEERANHNIDFMFVLPFRELNLVKHDQYSLHRLLLDFHPELRELEDGEYKDCQIVLIFDGLDESRLPLNFQENQKLSDVTQTSSVDVLMTSLIQGTLLSSALLWITSRPAAASQIPSQCICQVTEVRGFNDPQKEEYFRKRITDHNQANRIISQIKAARSLHIMCHMPVFCWISATVLQQVLEQDDGKEAPKTLTEMFIHFLLIQTTRKNQKYQKESEADRQRLLELHKGVILKLAELAFKHLEYGNLMFYEEDLRECGIDVSEASLYSGMCTEIFREECVFQHKKVYCFVHLSIQEFLAALHVFVSYLKKNMLTLETFLNRMPLEDEGEGEEEQEEEEEVKHDLEFSFLFDLYSLPLFDLLKGAVDKALESKTGHLDLFLRFLSGISVERNQTLLKGLLTNTHNSSECINKTCKYIKELKRKDPSPERYIHLLHCLFEMNDYSLHEEVQKYLKSQGGFSGELSPAHCSAVAQMLLMSEEVLDVFELCKYKTSEEGQRRLLPAVRCCRKAVLAGCKLTEKSCEVVASALQSANSPLRELDLSQNDLQESEEKLLSALQSPNCKLETLRLVGCKLRGRFLALAHQGANSHLRELDMSDSELEDHGGELLHQPLNQDCKVRLARCKLKLSSSEVVVSVLQSYISQLSELDMSGCDLQTSEEKQLSGLRHPNCHLEKLRLVGCKLNGRFLAFTLQWANSHLRELDISDSELQDCVGELLHQPLNQDCKVRLISCRLKLSSSEIVVSVLQSCISHLSELDMSDCDLQTSEEKQLSGLRNPNCHLEKLRLVGCKLNGRFLASTLQWANSHLRELDISDSELQDCVGELIHQPLNQDCKVRLISRKLKLSSSEVVVSVLQSCISQLSELDMSGCDLQTSEEKLLSGLRNPNCHLEKLRLVGCKLNGRFLASTLQWANSHLRELDISDSELQDCVGELIHQPLNQDCKVRLISRELKYSSPEVVVSVLQSYISQLSELDMSGCDLQTSEEKLLSGLRNPNCHLEKLRLSKCGISDEGYVLLALTLMSNPSCVKDLDVSNNHPGESAQKLLSATLEDPHRKVEAIQLKQCHLSKASCEIMASVLQRTPSHLRELDMSDNDLQDEGVELLCVGLREPQCKLETLRLAGCKLTEESCKAVASALQSSISLKELDLSDNDLKDSGVWPLSTGLSNPHCKLQTLRLACCKLTEESCKAVASALQFSISLKELDLSDNDLKDSGVQLLSTGVSSPHCKLQTLRLAGCKLTVESCKAVASALQSSICLKELDLSHNDLKDSGVQLLSTGLRSPHCKLQTLRLSKCGISDEGYVLLALTLMSNPSCVKDLDVSDNHPGESAQKLLSATLEDPHRKVEAIQLKQCHLSKASCEMMASVLQRTPSHLRELDMSDNDLQDEGMELLCVGLREPQCKLETLRLAGCKLTEKSCKAVASALQSLVSLTELDLSHNDLKESGVQLLSKRLSSPHCKLQTLRLAGCELTEESCKAVASALQSLVSLTELDLSHNDLKESGVRLLSKRLSSPHCKLQTLRLAGCKLTEESCKAVASALQSSISLKELDLSDNDLKDSGVQLLSTGASSPHCKLQTLRLSGCLITHKGCSLLSSALKSNPYLKQLDLSYNHPGDSGVRELTDRLNDPNCKLETFRYDHGGECRIKPGPRKYACELTLDPNTAHPDLSFSEGNRKVTRVSEVQPYPDHPERFDRWVQVLCREGLTGRCYWEAEWSGDKANIAVAYKSIQRKGESDDTDFGRNAKSWRLHCSDDSYIARHNNKRTDIPAPSSRSRRVGVYLDWPAGTLSFYSVSSDTLTHLHTLHSTFTEPLYPGFCVWPDSPVSLCHIT